jgi:hypothetical protein
MPRLRKLVARHDIFPYAQTTMRVGTARVRNNKDLEEFHLILPPCTIRNPTLSPDTEAFGETLQTLGDDAFVVGDFEDPVVTEMSTVAKFATLARKPASSAGRYPDSLSHEGTAPVSDGMDTLLRSYSSAMGLTCRGKLANDGLRSRKCTPLERTLLSERLTSHLTRSTELWQVVIMTWAPEVRRGEW